MKGRTVIRWLVRLAIAGPVLLILYVAFDVLFLSTWLSEHGYTFSGASYKWYKAMKRGDAQEAEYWARRMIRYANPDVHENYPWHPAYAYTHLAAAYELAGKYEAALAVYEDYSRLQDDCFFRWPMPAARIHYKLGDKAKAFLLYCQVARWLQDRRYEVRMYIVGSRPYEKALSPFSSYDDFLQFMFQQWEQTGKAEEYRQTLEFLEAMAHDLSEYDEQWKTAMNTGDAARAKQLAKWLIIRSSDSDFTPYYRPSSRTEAYRRLAAAHELAGEYEEALRVHERYDEVVIVDELSPPLAIGRILFKMGRKQEAFRKYCEYAATLREQKVKGYAVDGSDIVADQYALPYEHALSPFKTYEQFLQFAREEWEATGKDDKYRPAMEFLESLAHVKVEPISPPPSGGP